MAPSPWKRSQTLLSHTLVLALMESMLMESVLPPQPAAAINFDVFGIVRAIFMPRRSVGVARGRRGGAAVRDPDVCPPVKPPLTLTALVPDTDEPIKTSDAYPLFWFYVPYALKPSNVDASASSGAETYRLKFVLQDEQNKDVYQTTFALPETTVPGVLSLRFFSPKAALEPGKKYRWYFLVYCHDREESYEPAFVEGLIQREPLSKEQKQKIEQEEPQNRFLVYAQANLWYDTLAALELNRSTVSAATFQSNWEAVLKGSGLDATLSQQPIVGHYYVPADS